MDKSNPYLEKMFPESERLVVDENAFTLAQIAELRNCNASSAGRIARNKVRNGEWEQVFKSCSSGNHKFIKAFRPKMK